METKSGYQVKRQAWDTQINHGRKSVEIFDHKYASPADAFEAVLCDQKNEDINTSH